MNVYKSPIWGAVSMPETITELLSIIMENKHGNGFNVSYWRGQAEIEWLLNSSIVRKAQKEEPLNGTVPTDTGIEQSISFWEENLLHKAKRLYYDYDEHSRKIGDVELLAKLQHHGAATRLLDFSKNVLIALWFCVSDTERNKNVGLLLGIDTYVIAGLGEGHFDFKMDYPGFVKELNESDSINLVDVPVVTPRVLAQGSVFLCSKCHNSSHGCFLLPEEKYYKAIAISPELKKQCVSILTEQFNITPYTIYPDIEGFARANSVKWKFSEFERW